jgi:hypothetical protein
MASGKQYVIPTPINSLTSYVGWAPAHLCKPRCKRLLFQSLRFGGQEPTLRKINLLFGVGIKATNNANDPSIVLDKAGFPIVAWFEFDPATSYTIYVKRWNGQRWVQLGSALTADTFPRAGLDLSIDSKGNPIIVFDGADVLFEPWTIHVKRWNGFKWIELGSPTSDSAVSDSVAVDNTDAPIITWKFDTNLYASRWNGSRWVQLGGQFNDHPIPVSYAYSSIAIDTSGKPVLTFDDGGQVTVKRWTGTTWEKIGDTLGVNSGERLGITVNRQNKAVVSWLENVESTANVYVKQQK